MLTHDGPTPRGGVRSEATLTDAQGAPTDDPAEAVAVEIVEFDAGGAEVGRSYGRTDLERASEPTAMDDEDTDVAQGASWDLTVSEKGMIRPVDSLARLSALLERDALGERQFRTTVAGLLTMPSWDNAPATLRTEVNAYLEATRQ